MDWLNRQADENDVVMGAMSTGNLLPARTNLRVFLGHGPETLESTAKKEDVVDFFTNQVALEVLESRYNIQVDYIFYGPLERDLAATEDIEPSWQETTMLIYDHNGYQIYEVIE
jgi:hypothetical protein